MGDEYMTRLVVDEHGDHVRTTERGRVVDDSLTQETEVDHVALDRCHQSRHLVLRYQHPTQEIISLIEKIVRGEGDALLLSPPMKAS
jgi:hypothetical protein